jgi:hypothetical protein
MPLSFFRLLVFGTNQQLSIWRISTVRGEPRFRISAPLRPPAHPRDFLSCGDYGLRDITQERYRTGSNLLIIISSFLEGEVHHYTGLRLNTPDVVRR